MLHLVPLVAVLVAPSPPMPAGRPLTAAEQAMLEPIFGDAVDYDTIRVVHGRAVPVQGDHTYMTIGSVVYAPGPLYRRDFARSDVASQAALVHEVAHVWQRANGVNVVAEAALTLLATRGRYIRAYRYDLVPGRDLLDYAVEQQATILEDYFVWLESGRLAGGRAPADYQDALRRFRADPTYARRDRRAQIRRASAPPARPSMRMRPAAR